jgi:hypothetical protein
LFGRTTRKISILIDALIEPTDSEIIFGEYIHCCEEFSEK